MIASKVPLFVAKLYPITTQKFFTINAHIIRELRYIATYTHNCIYAHAYHEPRKWFIIGIDQVFSKPLIVRTGKSNPKQ